MTGYKGWYLCRKTQSLPVVWWALSHSPRRPLAESVDCLFEQRLQSRVLKRLRRLRVVKYLLECLLHPQRFLDLWYRLACEIIEVVDGLDLARLQDLLEFG